VPNNDLLEAHASCGLAILHITAASESFAIDSFSIVCPEGDFGDGALGPWLPIASDVAVGPASEPGTVTIIPVAEAACVRRMNKAIAGRSTIFAAASKALVEKLVAALPKP
jgi:hypothetical protein